MKLDTQNEMSMLYESAQPQIKEVGIDVKEDEFMIIQPYDNGNVIIFEVVEEDGGRTVKQKVFDAGIVLPKKEGTLDIFK
ncbi:2-hydroxyacyl-CoA dehydratase [Enterococcus dongliensis]|uniref:2-hydroxyacyl-CoA dehydratase n=1 Tax=Enterococcus xiangfangensis TaxID=1296537 RepID=A0ABU3F9F2_9ENTE|nr:MULTISPECIES: 2-hydroxyacyl-CoA dehydratase [Enterococcus]MDT2640663.1 2-hydroxyacyl-CoA dehydratase [Enterococcus dongliensis]MDT2759294.1 2-hydroxyacyl-CoA dehydratase [Enterococcus xiangfangensis]